MRGWLVNSYEQLVGKTQNTPLTIEELRSTPFALDWETIAKIFCIRETYYGLGGPRKNMLRDSTRHDLVMKLFSTELGAMEDTGDIIVQNSHYLYIPEEV